MQKFAMHERANPLDDDTQESDSLEAIIDRQLEKLSYKFLVLAQLENEKFVTRHAGVAVTAGAATGAYALVEAGIKIFASMISRLPPERQEDYIDNLVKRFEPTLRSRITEAAEVLRQH